MNKEIAIRSFLAQDTDQPFKVSTSPGVLVVALALTGSSIWLKVLKVSQGGRESALLQRESSLSHHGQFAMNYTVWVPEQDNVFLMRRHPSFSY